MLYSIKNFLRSKAGFWRARQFWQKNVSFNFFKQLYRIQFNYREEKTSASILKHSLSSFIVNIIYAIFFITIFEYFFPRFFPIKIPLVISEGDLLILVSTTVTIGGVFLALYFTAVSAVAGNFFMRATENLQRLFLRERKGQQYIRTLGLTIVVGVFYLVLTTFDYPISPFGPIIIAVLAAYAIIRFMSLGLQTFYFLHPIEASATIIGDAAYAIQNATIQGFGPKKDYLQNHYRKQAESSLKTLQSLIDFGVNVINLSDEQLVTVAKYAGGLFNYYITRKKLIPTESYWFKRKSQFRKWLFADSSEIILALNTGTPLSPKNIKDNTWFEEESIDIILKLFRYFIEKQKWESAQICLEVLVSIVEKLGLEFYDDVAELTLKKVNLAIKPILATTEKLTDLQTRRGYLAIIDTYSRLAIAVIIGFLHHLDKRDSKKLVEEIRAIRWSQESRIYESTLPGKLLPKLESTARQYQTEKIIEGKQISPEWYLITVTTQQYLFELKYYFDYVKSLHKNFFKRNVDILMNNKQPLLTAQLVQRWLEFINKLGACGTSFEKLIKDCACLQYVKDLPWVAIDFDKERTAFESMDKEAVDKMVNLLPTLMQLPQSELEDLPDYFGQAYTFGVEACYQACFENDTERFKEVFPIVGYAKLYAELYQNNDLWKVCENVWNNYLSNTNARDIIGLIVATSQYRDSVFKIMPRAMLRSNWDIKFRSKLQEMNLVTDPFENHIRDRNRSINHQSPIIRVLARYGDLLADARNIFFITYLSKHQAAKGITFPDRRNLKEQIERESKQQNNHPEHGNNP